MNEDQVKEVTKDAVELPQIRVPVRGTKNAVDLATEQVDIKKLSKFVEKAFGEIANVTWISEKEMLHVIKDIHADVVKQANQEAIKKISLASALDTEFRCG